MYADELTDSMDKAISETNRRRKIQEEYNKEHNITPTSIKKEIRETIRATYQAAEDSVDYGIKEDESVEDVINRLNDEMVKYAQNLEFEKAAEIRDKIKKIQGLS